MANSHDEAPATSGVQVATETSGQDPGEIIKDKSATNVDEAGNEKAIKVGETEVVDIFQPFPPDPNARPERQWVVTIRAVVLGCMIGTAVSASSLYLGKYLDSCRGAPLTRPDSQVSAPAMP